MFSAGRRALGDLTSCFCIHSSAPVLETTKTISTCGSSCVLGRLLGIQSKLFFNLVLCSSARVSTPFTFMCTELEQIILKFTWKHNRLRITNAILREKNKAGGITLPVIRQQCKAKVMKTAWYSPKHRLNHWNRIEKNKLTHLGIINP